MMLGRVVDYLKSNGVALRLVSLPAPEPKPSVAVPFRPASSITIETRVVLVDGRPAIGCIPAGDSFNYRGLGAGLGAGLVQEGTATDLPWPFGELGLPIPPLGRLFGAPLFVDTRVTLAPIIVFAAFAPTDVFELAYDDFARLEQPRVVEFAIAGELSPAPLH